MWHDKAWVQYLEWQNQDKKTLKKINHLLTDIDRNGYKCTGRPEPLKGDFAGYWSVRIDKKKQDSIPHRREYFGDSAMRNSLWQPSLKATRKNAMPISLAHAAVAVALGFQLLALSF